MSEATRMMPEHVEEIVTGKVLKVFTISLSIELKSSFFVTMTVLFRPKWHSPSFCLCLFFRELHSVPICQKKFYLLQQKDHQSEYQQQ